MHNVRKPEERVLLVGIAPPKQSIIDAEDSLQELHLLATTAGGLVVHEMLCPVKEYSPATLIGSGKIDELKLLVQEHETDLVIFDEDLSPAQQRNIEKNIQKTVLDRTGLILDIFALRARSSEGKMQVELAQLEYLLPRLAHRWADLSRLGGGIGTRGPGETQLETDRRVIRTKISRIKHDIKKLRIQRAQHRKQRQRNELFTISLVGYTNAGKSQLLTQLTSAETLVEDKLFATLDPLTRRLRLPDNRIVLVTDTVGFIKKLPHHLIAAFRATLEEVLEADLLLHVIDMSHKHMTQQLDEVEVVLGQLNALDKPRINVFNKIDIVPALQRELFTNALLSRDSSAVVVSALYGDGIDSLLNRIQSIVAKQEVHAIVTIPYEHSRILGKIFELGSVEEQRYEAEYILLRIKINPIDFQRLVGMSEIVKVEILT